MEKEWVIKCSFTEGDFENQLRPDVYDTLCEHDLLDDLGNLIVNSEEREMNENFGETVGWTIRYYADQLMDELKEMQDGND